MKLRVELVNWLAILDSTLHWGFHLWKRLFSGIWWDLLEKKNLRGKILQAIGIFVHKSFAGRKAATSLTS